MYGPCRWRRIHRWWYPIFASFDRRWHWSENSLRLKCMSHNQHARKRHRDTPLALSWRSTDEYCDRPSPWLGHFHHCSTPYNWSRFHVHLRSVKANHRRGQLDVWMLHYPWMEFNRSKTLEGKRSASNERVREKKKKKKCCSASLFLGENISFSCLSVTPFYTHHRWQ